MNNQDKVAEAFKDWYLNIFCRFPSTKKAVDIYCYEGFKAAYNLLEAETDEVKQSMQRLIDHHNARADKLEADNKKMVEALEYISTNWCGSGEYRAVAEEALE